MPVVYGDSSPTRVLTTAPGSPGSLLDADLPYNASQLELEALRSIPSSRARSGQPSISHTNLVPNSAAGNGTVGWVSSGTGLSLSNVATSPSPDGIPNAIRASGTLAMNACWVSPVPTGGQNRTVTQLVDSGARPAAAGQVYHLRMWAKRDHAPIAGETWSLRAYTWRSDGTWNADATLTPFSGPTVGEWTLLTGSITLPANTAFVTGALRLNFTNSNEAVDFSVTGFSDNIGSAPPDPVNGVMNNAVFTGTAHQSPSIRLNPTAVNPLLAPRGTAGAWSAYQGVAVTGLAATADSPDLGANGTCYRATTGPTSTTQALIVIPTLGDSASGTTAPSVLNARGWARVQPSSPYSARVWARTGTSAVTEFRLLAYYRDINGGWLTSQTGPVLVQNPGIANWHLLEHTFTAPANAAWATFWAAAYAPIGTSHDFRVTYGWHGAGTEKTYFDGSYPGAAWFGTPNSSGSYRLV